MGTNYYLQEKKCTHCGRAGERLHIGKSSYGWHFALHVSREGVNVPQEPGDRFAVPDSLEQWTPLFRSTDFEIVDEYDRVVSADKMLDVITNRSSGPLVGRERPSEEWLGRNYAETGLNGLVRHQVNGWHCIANTEGTWDLIVGEFS